MNNLFIKYQVTATTEFPTYAAVKLRYTIKFNRGVYYRNVWLYYVDGFESEHAFTLN